MHKFPQTPPVQTLPVECVWFPVPIKAWRRATPYKIPSLSLKGVTMLFSVRSCPCHMESVNDILLWLYHSKVCFSSSIFSTIPFQSHIISCLSTYLSNSRNVLVFGCSSRLPIITKSYLPHLQYLWKSRSHCEAGIYTPVSVLNGVE